MIPTTTTIPSTAAATTTTSRNKKNTSKTSSNTTGMILPLESFRDYLASTYGGGVSNDNHNHIDNIDDNNDNDNHHHNNNKDDIILRSLRRRLWYAFQTNNIVAALQLYQMTRQEWQTMIWQEAMANSRSSSSSSRPTTTTITTNTEQQRRRRRLVKFWKTKTQQQHQQQPSTTLVVTTNLPLPAVDSSSNNKPNKQDTTTATSTTTTTISAAAAADNNKNNNIGILQKYMNPSEPFMVDDYYDPWHDPFPEDYVQENECIPIVVVPTTPTPTTATATAEAQQQGQGRRRLWRHFSWRRRRQQQQQRHDEEQQPRTATTTTTTTTIWEHVDRTTPLHEAARLGSGALVRLMLLSGQPPQPQQQHAATSTALLVDPMTRNGAQQTALHMVAGGMTTTTLTKSATTSEYYMSLEEAAAAAEAQDKDNDDNNNNNNNAMLCCIPPPKSILLNTSNASASAAAMSRHHKKSKTWLKRIRRSRRQPLSSSLSQNASTFASRTIASTSATATTAATNTTRNNFQTHSSLAVASTSTSTTLLEQQQQQQLDEDRLDATLALLSWSPPPPPPPPPPQQPQPQPPSSSSQQQERQPTLEDDNNSVTAATTTTTTTMGISTNSVDVHGRTALHYAAALGRSVLCQTILDYNSNMNNNPNYYNWGTAAAAATTTTLLTVVDDVGRTPCEWAAATGHGALAAYLEARAVLYRDPYGADDDVMLLSSAGFLPETDGFSRRSLKIPFSWFENVWNVQEEREIRLEQCLKGIQVLLRKQQEQLVRERNETDRDGAVCADGKSAATSKRENDDGSSGSNDQDGTEQHKNGKASTSASSESPLEEENSDIVSLQLLTTDDDDDDPKIRRQVEVLSRLVNGQQLLHMTHIEIFLSYFKWDIYEAFDSFFNKPWQESFAEVGISFPLLDDKHTVSKPHFAGQKQKLCLICCEEFDIESSQWVTLCGCNHSFCCECLGDYLADLAKSRSTGLCIFCPHHNCNAPLSPTEISDLVRTREDYQALLQTANDNFVSQAHDVRYCPHPGCEGIVKFLVPRYAQTYVVKKGLHPDLLQIAGAACAASGEHGEDVPLTCEGVGDPTYYQADSLVQPKTAHRFCFVCGETGIHWPITCQRLAEWNDLVQERIGQVDEGQGEKYADLAQKLWMKTNTRPCPKCNAPIQKNEGCNHMTCGRCSYEFCWICRNDWKLHNSRTGGFFRCNRWVDQKEHDFYDPDHPDPASAREPANEDLMDPSTMTFTYGTAMHETFVSTLRSREMSRFLHHYRRWGAHKESSELERRMKDSVCKRLTPVVQAAAAFSNDPNLFGGRGISFVHGAFFELLECRSMLQHSYAFSYLRYRNIRKELFTRRRRLVAERMVFEERQGELEMITEQISDVVARSHLRATQSQIQFLTAAAMEKRKEFTDLMISILVEQALEEGAKPKERHHMPKRLVKEMSRAIRTVTRSRSSTAGRHHPYQEGDYHDYWDRNNREQEDHQIEAAIRASLAEHQQQQTTNAAETAAATSDTSSDDGDDRTDHIHLGWVCPVCTYRNMGSPGITDGQCVMCGNPRVPRERHLMDDYYYEIIEREEDEGVRPI